MTFSNNYKPQKISLYHHCFAFSRQCNSVRKDAVTDAAVASADEDDDDSVAAGRAVVLCRLLVVKYYNCCF